jgi:hypothetical protein
MDTGLLRCQLTMLAVSVECQPIWQRPPHTYGVEQPKASRVQSVLSDQKHFVDKIVQWDLRSSGARARRRVKWLSAAPAP